MRHYLRAVVLVVLALAPAPAWAQKTYPDPGTFVVDHAGLVSVYRGTLESLLRELEQKTGAQVKVLTVKSLDGEEVFSFAQRHAEAWKLGQRGKDNGALIVVVPRAPGQSGELWIHTGYGLEEVLPDSYNGELARSVVQQYMRAGRVSEGIAALTSTVANRIAEAANTTLGGGAALPVQRVRRPSATPSGAICGGILPLIIFILILRSIFGRRRSGRHWGGGVWDAVILSQMLRGMGGGRRSGGWGGSRSFGGGFGGFGGSFGGGGRFGGGGGGAKW